MTETVKTVFTVGKLKMRHEGEFWVAYYVMPDDLENHTVIGSIRMSLIENNKDCRAIFLTLMSHIVTDMVQEITGVRPEMIREPTPENERSGHA